MKAKLFGHVLWKIILREVQFILKDSRLRSVVLVAPFLYAILMCAVYWREFVTDVPIALVQEDVSQIARTAGRLLDTSPKLQVTHRPVSLQEAKQLLLDGTVGGIVVIERDFTEQLKSGKGSRIVALTDTTNLVIANTIASTVSQVTQTLSAGVGIQKLQKLGLTRDQAMVTVAPIRPEIRPLFNPSYSYTMFMVPGLLITVLQQVILLGLALSWSGERESGSISTLFAISRNPMILLVGKAIPYLVIYGAIAVLFVSFFFPLVGIATQGRGVLLTIYTGAFLLAVVTWGAWFSVWLRSRLFATQALMFLAMPSFLLSGYTWPDFALPGFLRTLSQLLPLTHYVQGLRRLCLIEGNQQGIFESTGILLLFTVVHVGLALGGIKYLLRRSETEALARDKTIAATL